MRCLSIVQRAYTRPSKTLWFLQHKQDTSRIAALDTLLPLISRSRRSTRREMRAPRPDFGTFPMQESSGQ